MSISDNTLANATNFNAAFASRSTAQTIAGNKAFTNGIALTPADVATSATINALASSTSIVRMTGSTATNLNGITAGAYDGQILTIYNSSSATVTVNHESGSATAANRITLKNASSLAIRASESYEFFYSTLTSRWVQKFVEVSTSVSGSASFSYQAKTANYTAIIGEIVNCTSGTFTVTLPTAVSVAGQCVVVKNSGTGTISIATTSSQTIDGLSSDTIINLESKTYMSNGANWIII